MKYLLDVNVLVAWGWSDHADHERVIRWIAVAQRDEVTEFLTSAIPQLGFVRVSVQRMPGQVGIEEACEVLESMLTSLGKLHSFLADDLPSAEFPAWCRSASRTTDAHLLQLAHAHNAKLATLDTRIPDSFVLPPLIC